MFHFPGFASAEPYPCGYLGIPPGGFPHSGIHGSTPACGSPWLFAACHALHRLLRPRHPPLALSSLATKLSKIILPIHFALARGYRAIPYSLVKDQFPLQGTLENCLNQQLPKIPFPGGGERTRTVDPRLAKPVLSQLSYTPIKKAAPSAAPLYPLVGLGGFEPPTSRLSGVRSDLS